jgi:hypothetical protein
MKVVLSGNWPAALTAGTLILSRSRSFGIPLSVEVVGDPKTLPSVMGPAVVHSHVLSSCGVGRDLGQGGLVVVPGRPTEPVLMCLQPHGDGEWFEVDASGLGCHPATQAFVRLVRDQRPTARHASALLRRLFRWLGVPAEPALLDLLFAAPAPALTRISLSLRAGQAMTGETGGILTQSLRAGCVECPLIQQDGPDGKAVLDAWVDGELDAVLSCLSVGGRLAVVDWLEAMLALSMDDGGRDIALVGAMAELLGNLILLPPGCIMPPTDAAADAVANGLVRVLGARGGEPDASKSLLDVYRFLGGKFVPYATYPYAMDDTPPPESRAERWRWFVESVVVASGQVDELWASVMDPAS